MPNGIGTPQKTEAALRTQGTLVMREREIFLHQGFVGDVAQFVDEFGKENGEFTNYVGVPHEALGTQDYAVENPRATFWKDSATPDWRFTPTGAGTFDGAFPESTSVIRLDTPPPHYAYLMGLVEIGTSNNVLAVAPTDINGRPRGRTTIWYTSRLGDVKLHYFTPAMRMKVRGRVRIAVETETNAPIEFGPVAVHIAAFEMLTAASWDTNVTAV